MSMPQFLVNKRGHHSIQYFGDEGNTSSKSTETFHELPHSITDRRIWVCGQRVFNLEKKQEMTKNYLSQAPT